ncbi:putative pentatricopeptide repeat-containing protein At3g01580 [Elaeis guineensis]|uniref:Pentatricopeptide repeat-containing protein At3g01580 n=1 Tax=Elaeis guineensis var. tenera TaxID=51953 RepID=A0A6I9QMD7_ELAGV|nr:putative pentatricopeptide repeat-containing protein At3g01580 [Elaeis guineensis]
MISSPVIISHPLCPPHPHNLYRTFRPHSEWKKTPNPLPLRPKESISHGRNPESLNLEPMKVEPKQVLNTTHSKETGTSPTTLLSHTQSLNRLINSNRLAEAMDLYVDIRNKGLEPGIIVESVVIDALMKSGRVTDAFQVFESMPERNVITWTSMLSGCVRNDCQAIGFFLFVEMLESGVLPNDFTFNAMLQACADQEALGLGEQVHSLVVRAGLSDDRWIGNCLIDFYSRCGLMAKATRIFDRILELDLVSFTSLISGFCRNNQFELAVKAFDRMVRFGLEPNEHTITSILTACGPLLGEQIHGYMIKTMIAQSVYSGSALIDFYSRNSEFKRARDVFEKLESKNMVTWSSMISCCLRNERVEEAMRMFYDMVCAGFKPNEFTFAVTFGACGLCSESIAFGHQLHCSAIKLNLLSDTRVSNALLTMYARSGEIEELEKLFERIENPDIVSWSAAISGYFQNGFDERSTRLLCQMHRKGYTPNEHGFSSALSSCANLALLDQGRQFHGLALKLGCDLDVCTGNALINMYSKCGCIDDARLAFDVMHTHDVISWNSLIHGYAHHGHGKKALKVFDKMAESSCCIPDHSTFVGILAGCSHVGNVNEALRYFKIMRDYYGVVPSSSHYACIVDMMGRAGRLGEALHIVDQMPFEVDVLVWKTLLASCKLHKNLELGRFAAEKIMELSPKDSASYVLLSNLHALHGEWEDAERVRGMMEERGVKKDAGWSWIEIKSEVCAFVARDNSHPEAKSIYQMLEELFEVMKDEGYSPSASFSDL